MGDRQALNSGPMQEEQLLLMAEPSFQPNLGCLSLLLSFKSYLLGAGFHYVVLAGLNLTM